MRRITISLFENERDALYELAQIERRDTRQQAALLVREALEQRGLLPGERPFLETDTDINSNAV